MKYTKILLLLVLSFFSTQAISKITGYGYISYVVDGDTFDIETKRGNIENLLRNDYVSKKYTSQSNFRARIANIDTAEKETVKGKIVKGYAYKKFFKEKVFFECYKKGNYGRSICSVETTKGDIANILIKNGFTKYITRFGNHPTKHNTYTNSERKSQNMTKKEDLKNKVFSFLK